MFCGYVILRKMDSEYWKSEVFMVLPFKMDVVIICRAYKLC